MFAGGIHCGREVLGLVGTLNAIFKNRRCLFTAAAAAGGGGGACFCCHNSLRSTPTKFYLLFLRASFLDFAKIHVGRLAI